MAIQPDKALTQTSGDDYSFSPVAEHVAWSIARIPSTEGLVVGIGGWGSGKTSFAELHRGPPREGPAATAGRALQRLGAVDESDAAMGLLSEVRGSLSREIKAVKEQKASAPASGSFSNRKRSRSTSCSSVSTSMRSRSPRSSVAPCCRTSSARALWSN